MPALEAEAAYLDELVSRLGAVLGDELVGVYAGGSYALGDYEPSRSDLDVSTVTRGRTDPQKGAAVVEAVRHEALPCPARDLELVLYTVEAVRSGTVEPGFDLNLNTGRGMTFRADFAPVEGERHWFAIDRSVLAEHGIALLGPPANTVFQPAPRETLVPVLAEALRWYLRAASPGDDAILNACRSLRYAREGTWSSKVSAGEWALEQLADPEIVSSALAARRGHGAVDPEPVRKFLENAVMELDLR